MKNHLPASNEQEYCQGMIERIVFHNPENGFCVLRVKAKGWRDLVTVIGHAAQIHAGEYIECQGNWIHDAKHGQQFKAAQIKAVQPTTLEGIKKYLSSGLIKGIGPTYAKRLVAAFGEAVFDIIEQTPERLSEIEGIGKIRRAQIMDAWQEQKVVRKIMVFLHSHGVGTARAVRIYKTYGDNAIEKIQTDPYCLALDIYGIGFKTADALAQKLGIAPDAMVRIQAGTRHCLQEFASQGHCAVPEEPLIKAVVELIDVDVEQVKTAIINELQAERLIREMIDEELCYFSAALYYAEVNVVEHLKRIQSGRKAWDAIDADKAIPWVEQRTGLTFSTSQRKAVELAINNKVMIITGGPGVGKTTVVNSILKILMKKRVRVTLCAPTGRAAKRMSEATGLEAKTIHRLLGRGGQGFNLSKAAQIDTDLIVVDETSMIDIVLMQHLLKAIPDTCALLFVGDVDQLPSVGPGSVLADFIRSETIVTERLTEIFRQAQASKIIVNAHRINQGFMPEWENTETALSDFYFIAGDEPEDIQQKLIHVVTQRIPKRFHFNPARDIQVLTPMNRAGLGARSLNFLLQQQLNGEQPHSVTRFGWTFGVGDKVIQLINNYDKDIFNGDTGFITQLDSEEQELIAQFDGREITYRFSELDELALAYAITIHKSQGSEYPAVVIPLATQHFTLLERNLLYTAVTRGKRLVVLIGQKKAVGMAVKNMRAQKRLTRLAQRLQEANESVLS